MANEEEKIVLMADLFDNLLTEVEGDYSARIRNTGTVRNEHIAKRILERGSEYRKETIENILKIADQEKIKALQQGKSVIDGTGQYLLGVKGAFDGESAPFEAGKHSLVVSYIPGKSLRKALQEITVETRKAAAGQSVNKITDPTTGKMNETITPLMPLVIDGANIKVVGTSGNEALVGVYFVTADEATSTAAMLLVHNNPSQLTVVAPALGEGDYFVEIRTQYSSGSGTLVKQPRIIRYPLLLTVGGNGEDDRPVIE